jgi:hypothetical protein
MADADIAHSFGGSVVDDNTRIAQMATELAARHPMELVMHPLTVLQLVGLVQLALRHPGISPDLREAGTRFVSAAHQYFADAPATLDVIRRGDDPREDIRFESQSATEAQGGNALRAVTEPDE